MGLTPFMSKQWRDGLILAVGCKTGLSLTGIVYEHEHFDLRVSFCGQETCYPCPGQSLHFYVILYILLWVSYFSYWFWGNSMWLKCSYWENGQIAAAEWFPCYETSAVPPSLGRTSEIPLKLCKHINAQLMARATESEFLGAQPRYVYFFL